MRGVVLGHVQQGGTPSPFDRINGVRLASGVMDWLDARTGRRRRRTTSSRRPTGRARSSELDDLVDLRQVRLRTQWWTAPAAGVLDDLGSRPVARTAAAASA